MDKQYIEIAKEFSNEIRKLYPEINITSIRFVSITEQQEVEISAMPYNLEDAKYAIVICDFEYPFHRGFYSNFFVLFIDNKGRATNKLEINGWKMWFDEPVTGGKRSPVRHCFIQKDDLKIDINCTECDLTTDIAPLWKTFVAVFESSSTDEVRKHLEPYAISNTVYLYKIVRDYKAKRNNAYKYIYP